jgi:hypothetical protein
LSVSNRGKTTFGYKHPASQLEDGEYLAVVTPYPKPLFDIDIPTSVIFNVCKGEFVFLLHC